MKTFLVTYGDGTIRRIKALTIMEALKIAIGDLSIDHRVISIYEE